MEKLKYLLYFIVFAVLFEFAGTYAYEYYDDIDDNFKMKVHYIDVWQGDATFIELPNGKTVLIDAGEAEYGKRVVSYIKKLKYDKIDYLFATHPHSDHIGGLKYVIESFNIGSIYVPDVINDTSSYYDLLSSIEAKKKNVRIAQAGKNVILDDDLNLKIIAPNNTYYEDLNNYSTVLKLTYKEKSFLFMADAEYESEMELLNSSFDISADVLKVGHHGSTSSTNYNFLKKVNPKIAIISVGANNDYGHPKEKILEKLKNQKVKIYRTDLNGNIVVTTNGKNLKVKVDNGSYS